MTPCIEHNQKTMRYGKARYQGQVTNMHRVVYAKHNGVDLVALEGLVIRHTCDNMRCINPDHLVVGTHQDNVNDKMERKRHKRLYGLDNGSGILTPEQVEYIRANYKPYHKQFGATALGKRFGVDHTTISCVALHKSH